MSKLDEFLLTIDTVNLWIGRFIAFVIPLIMLFASYEVIMRYVFNAPTIWVWDINKMLFAFITFMGAGYTLMKGGHIAVDVFYAKWSDRTKAVVDIVTFPLFIIFIGILLYTLGEFALVSIQEREVVSSAWAPPFYPLKIAMFVGTFLLFMQGFGKFLRDLRAAITPQK